jgi:hypothetical protein
MFVLRSVMSSTRRRTIALFSSDMLLPPHAGGYTLLGRIAV